jgi:hypothetical protein
LIFEAELGSKLSHEELPLDWNVGSNREIVGVVENRLRNTWVVWQFAAGTNIAALSQAAGVSAHSLLKYAEFVTAPDPKTARAMLRDALG